MNPPIQTAALDPAIHRIASKLPNVGTTIFTVMSALATEKNAVNLGQGFPDFDCDPALVDAVTNAMRAGLNQYPPMPGVPGLRDQMPRQRLARQIGQDVSEPVIISLERHDYFA